MFENFRFELFISKLEKYIGNKVGYGSPYLKDYDIDGFPLTESTISSIPTLAVFDGSIIFFFKKPEWSIYVGVTNNRGIVEWLETRKSSKDGPRDMFSHKYTKSHIPDYIQKDILERILANKDKYICQVNKITDDILAKKFGKTNGAVN